jgi:hypothetical protein
MVKLGHRHLAFGKTAEDGYPLWDFCKSIVVSKNENGVKTIFGWKREFLKD